MKYNKAIITLMLLLLTLNISNSSETPTQICDEKGDSYVKERCKTCEDFDNFEIKCLTCESGWSIAVDQCRLNCVKFCRECFEDSGNADQNTCNTCITGPDAQHTLSLYNSNLNCIIPITDCTAYNYENLLCTACQSNTGGEEQVASLPGDPFTLEEAPQGPYDLSLNKCVKKIEFCDIHNYDGTCNTCITNYKASDDRMSCSPDIVYCIRYPENDKTRCLECRNSDPPDNIPHVPSEDQTLCVPKIEHCQVNSIVDGNSVLDSKHRNDAETCSKCDAGYHLTFDEKYCVAIITNCLVYEYDLAGSVVTGKCRECIPYVKGVNEKYLVPSIDKSKCVDSITYCQDHSNTEGICTNCAILETGETDECKTCFDNNDKANPCDSCYTFFHKTPDSSKCQWDIEYCENYSNNDGECDKCIDTHFVTDSKERCFLLIANCKIYADLYEICDTCEDPFKKSVDSRACVSEITNCKDYHKDGHCLLCETQDPAIVVSEGKHKCVNKIENCLVHKDTEDKCVKCENGYALSKTELTCQPLLQGCKVYLDTINTCEECISSVWVVAKDEPRCVYLIQGCKEGEHEADGECNDCIDGRTQSKSHRLCVPLINECIVYEEAIGKCEQCNDGFSPTEDKSACVAVIPFCTSYNFLGRCLACGADGDQNKAVSQDQTKCVNAVENCAQHTNDTEPSLCKVCNNGYALSKSRTFCVTEITYCTVYSDLATSTCENCGPKLKEDGSPEYDHTHSKDGSVCVPQISDCEDHTNTPYICEKCLINFSLSVEKKCVRTIPYCNIHNNTEGICDQCKTDLPIQYELTDSKNYCKEFIQYCKKYIEDPLIQRCETCDPDNGSGKAVTLLEDFGNCVLVIDQCQTYLQSGMCTVCNGDRIVIEAGQRCAFEILFCTTYNASDVTKCDACSNVDVERTPSSDSTKCVEKIEHCRDHSNADPTTCEQCDSGYSYTLSQRKCVLSITNCVKYEEDGTCNECATYYKQNGDNTQCVDLIQDCTQYIVEPDCTESCSFICNTCITNKTPSQNKLKCVPSIPNCQDHDNETENKCSLCIDNYVLPFAEDIPSVCMLEIDHCKTYTKDTNCSECKEDPANLVLSNDNRACVNRIDKCQVHSAAGICLTCENEPENTKTKDSMACVPKIDFCVDHLVDLTCEKCDSDKTTSEDKTKCVSFLANCKSYRNDGICGECRENYTFSEDNSKCVKIIVGCKGHDNIEGICNSCLDDKQIPNFDRTECVNSINNCLTHKREQNKIICAQCKELYIYLEDQDICIPEIKHCLLYNKFNYECDICQPGEYQYKSHSLGICRNTPEKCEKYAKKEDGTLDTDKCEVCYSTFYMWQNKCINYVKGCEEFNAEEKCTKCREGFNLKSNTCERVLEPSETPSDITNGDGSDSTSGGMLINNNKNIFALVCLIFIFYLIQ